MTRTDRTRKKEVIWCNHVYTLRRIIIAIYFVYLSPTSTTRRIRNSELNKDHRIANIDKIRGEEASSFMVASFRFAAYADNDVAADRTVSLGPLLLHRRR